MFYPETPWINLILPTDSWPHSAVTQSVSLHEKQIRHSSLSGHHASPNKTNTFNLSVALFNGRVQEITILRSPFLLSSS